MNALHHVDNLRLIAETKAKRLPNTMIADVKSAADYIEALHKKNVDLIDTVVAMLAAAGVDPRDPKAQVLMNEYGGKPSQVIAAILKRYKDTARMAVDALKHEKPREAEYLARIRGLEANLASESKSRKVLEDKVGELTASLDRAYEQMAGDDI